MTPVDSVEHLSAGEEVKESLYAAASHQPTVRVRELGCDWEVYLAVAAELPDINGLSLNLVQSVCLASPTNNMLRSAGKQDL